MATLQTNNNSDMIVLDHITDSVLGVGAYYGAKMHLCQLNAPYDRETQLVDLQAAEANYDGYVAASVTWARAGLDEAGNPEKIGTIPIFQDTGDTTLNQIYGAWLGSPNDDTLLGCNALDGAPVPMINDRSQVLLTVRLKFTPDGLVVNIS